MFKFSVFRKIHNVIENIDQFFQVVEESSLTFLQAIKLYLHQGVNQNFMQHLQIIQQNEKTADTLLKEIEKGLYKYSLLPEIRFDTMRLIQRTDDIQDMLKEVIIKFEIERPEFSDELANELINLTELSVKAAQFCCRAAATCFRTASEARLLIENALEYEHLADVQAEKCKRLIFQQTLSMHLAEKIHNRYFVEKIEAISDLAQSVAYTVNLIILKRFE